MKQLADQTFLDEHERDILTQCKQIVKAVDLTAEVILYGSRARGDAAEDSDYDLLILTDGMVNLQKEDLFRRRLYPIELETGAVLTVFLIARSDWDSPVYQAMPFRQNVIRDGFSL